MTAVLRPPTPPGPIAGPLPPLRPPPPWMPGPHANPLRKNPPGSPWGGANTRTPGTPSEGPPITISNPYPHTVYLTVWLCIRQIPGNFATPRPNPAGGDRYNTFTLNPGDSVSPPKGWSVAYVPTKSTYSLTGRKGFVGSVSQDGITAQFPFFGGFEWNAPGINLIPGLPYGVIDTIYIVTRATKADGTILTPLSLESGGGLNRTSGPPGNLLPAPPATPAKPPTPTKPPERRPPPRPPITAPPPNQPPAPPGPGPTKPPTPGPTRPPQQNPQIPGSKVGPGTGTKGTEQTNTGPGTKPNTGPGTSGAGAKRPEGWKETEPTGTPDKVKQGPGPGVIVTPKDAHVVNGKLITPGGAAPDIGSIARELGRVEKKLEGIMKKPTGGGSVDLGSIIDALQLIYELLTAADSETSYTVTAACVERGEEYPRSHTVEVAGALSLAQVAINRIDAIAELVAASQLLSQKVCGRTGSTPTNNVTVTAYEVME